MTITIKEIVNLLTAIMIKYRQITLSFSEGEVELWGLFEGVGVHGKARKTKYTLYREQAGPYQVGHLHSYHQGARQKKDG